MPSPCPITPAGFAALRRRYDLLLSDQRPTLVETISWAAANGDRSENGDYIYGRKRLREIDRELAHLARRMKAVTIVDPAAQEERGRAWFGATVTIVDGEDRERAVTLVGEDEADASSGCISWLSPLARALRGAAIGDLRTVELPAGTRDWEVVAIAYPEAATPAKPAAVNASGSTGGSASNAGRANR